MWSGGKCKLRNNELKYDLEISGNVITDKT